VKTIINVEKSYSAGDEVGRKNTVTRECPRSAFVSGRSVSGAKIGCQAVRIDSYSGRQVSVSEGTLLGQESFGGWLGGSKSSLVQVFETAKICPGAASGLGEEELELDVR
jgi:hypothetical protein